MGASSLSLRWFGCLVIIVSAAGCSHDASNVASPTAPSSLAGSSASLSDSRSPSSPQAGVVTPAAGPGASYDANGSWHFVVFDGASPNASIEGDFDAVFKQDADGNISFVDDDGNTITLTRLGTGVIITYKVSFVADTSPCDFELSGILQLDTRTNTGKAHVRVNGDDCSHGVQYVTLTKN